MTEDLKTPEQLAEEYADLCVSDAYYAPLKAGFLAGYQAAKDQLADADKVVCSTTMEEIKAVDTDEITPITNLPTPAKWISVKERLPEFYVLCAWWSSSDWCENGIASRDVGDQLDWWNAYDYWMPLPEPPKDAKE